MDDQFDVIRVILPSQRCTAKTIIQDSELHIIAYNNRYQKACIPASIADVHLYHRCHFCYLFVHSFFSVFYLLQSILCLAETPHCIIPQHFSWLPIFRELRTREHQEGCLDIMIIGGIHGPQITVAWWVGTLVFLLPLLLYHFPPVGNKTRPV